MPWTTKGLRLWNQFWYPQYSYRFWVAYRFVLMLGAAIHSVNASFTAASCSFWAPVGVIKLLSWPCDPNLNFYISSSVPIFCILAAIGFLYPWTSKLAFLSLIIQYGYMNSFGQVSHSEHLITMAVGIASLVRNRSDGDPALNYGWQLQLLKVYVVWIYFVNGLAKLVHGGFAWAFSDNFYLLLYNRPYLGPLGMLLQSWPPFVSMVLASFALILVELLAPLALVDRRLGYLFFFIWAGFHVGVTLLFGGHMDFFSQTVVATIFLPLGGGVWELSSVYFNRRFSRA